MNRLVLAILLSSLAAIMTDGFFGGVLFHDKYLAYPEIWRRGGGCGWRRQSDRLVDCARLSDLRGFCCYVLLVSGTRLRGGNSLAVRRLADRTSASPYHELAFH